MSFATDLHKRLTPPEVARRLGIHPDKVLTWIRSGELRAVNVAANPRGLKPRWRIDPADLAAFERRRSVQPMPVTPRRRRRTTGDVIEFF